MKNHESRDPKVEEWLEEEGVTFDFNPEFSIKRVDFDASIKNQARLNVQLVPEVVERYAELMESGIVFPAMVGYMKNNKLVFIDGNHRGQAHLLKGSTSIPVYVVKGANASKIIALTFMANTTHGLPNNEDERIEHALHMIREGVTQAYAANMMGLKSSEVSNAWRKSEADRRAAAIGVKQNEWNSISPASRVRVVSIANDQILKKAVSVITKLNMKSTEIDKLVNDIKRLKTDTSRTKFLNDILKDRADEVGVVTRGAHASQSRRYLVMTHGKGLIHDLHLKDFYTDLHPEEAAEYVSILKKVVSECNASIRELKNYV
jgi:predicted transcriptional regulator